ncbi:MAG: hypothetical protein IKW42_00825 [Alistipes sp.]|nr:hypothetical protein [Alistipes sp.]
MEKVLAFQTQTDDLTLQYDVIADTELSPDDITNFDSAQLLAITDSRLRANEQEIDKLNQEIDRLTNHADGLDYTIAVASGIICGLIDSFFVGEFSMSEGRAWGTDKVNSFVSSVAKQQGYKGDSLSGAVNFLEKRAPIAADSATTIFGGGRQHHLRDFAHHPTIVGLAFSLLTQFTGKVYGTNTLGAFIVADLPDKSLIGRNLPTKLSLGIISWVFHIVSDMAGSSGTIAAGGLGTGLPGPFVSLLKELSATPLFSHAENCNTFSVWVSKLFNGTLLSERDNSGRLIKESVQNFDLRSEIGIAHEVGKQAIPVVINECIVRSFYFIRRLIAELRSTKINTFDDLRHKIDWKTTLPFNNRTITRMITISTGIFVAVDVADATIRAANKSKGNSAAFVKNVLLRINFVGIGRFAVAICNDLYMGTKREHKLNQRMQLRTEGLLLHNVKISILQRDMWVEAKTTQEAILLMERVASEAIAAIGESMSVIGEELHTIRDNGAVENLSTEVRADLIDILKFGK